MSRAGRQVSCSGGPTCLPSIPFSNANDSQVISSEMDGTRISRRVYNMDHNLHPTDHVVPKIHNPVPHTCAAGSRCESGCTNQLMGYFCTPETCPCGADCVNLFKESPLLVGDDGVYTKEPVHANQLIAQYAGVIVGADDIPALAKAYAEKGIPNAFFAPLDDKIYIDANEIGNAARLIPRACPDSALCTMLRKYREGCPIQCVYARNDIPPGTRLTVTCTDAFSRAQTPPDCPCARCSERREVGTAGESEKAALFLPKQHLTHHPTPACRCIWQRRGGRRAAPGPRDALF